MDILTLTVPLTCLSIGLGITALVLPKWNCGGFFTTCAFTLIHLIIMALIVGGMALISIIFFVDICSACNPKWLPGPVCVSFKIILFALGAASLMAGNLLYALFCFAIGLCVASLVVPYWNCGGFFTTCVFTIIHLVVMGLLLGGLALFALVFLLDLFKTCRNTWVPGPVCNTCKILLSAVGAGCLLAGNLLYAAVYIKSTSYVMSFAGSIIAVHVVLLSLLSSRCLQGH
ncbi:unnamed protein product [Hydatigera taeniaeformis]|uniref:G_PROTEIN_RECEP_F1_2 domain-containing protein n=1 Tax=Hydatigena taeniaeformis TaxID=6205 RepID=A0A0R3WZS5_HYDTA|nr:unnamed protein product [Hydatigera taeniaeformis]